MPTRKDTHRTMPVNDAEWMEKIEAVTSSKEMKDMYGTLDDVDVINDMLTTLRDLGLRESNFHDLIEALDAVYRYKSVCRNRNKDSQ